VAFVTTKACGKGIRFGLRICQRIIEGMDGSISATNRGQRRSLFEILLLAAVVDYDCASVA